MRAREFVVERTEPESKSAPMTATYMFPTMPSSDPYQSYRFGIAMANHHMKHVVGPTEQKAVISAYTSEEEKIIKSASHQTGHSGKLITDKSSHEPKQTNVVSPVAKPKRNKYGV